MEASWIMVFFLQYRIWGCLMLFVFESPLLTLILQD